MLNRYFLHLREAFAERRSAPLPKLAWVIVAVVCCTLVFIGLALVAVSPDEPREYHFVNENGVVTKLSALYLAVAATCSLATLVTLWRAGDSHAWVWLLFTVGFAFLSFDELLQFHERAGSLINRFASSGEFRSWNDIIVILYGVVAVPMLVAVMPGLLRWRLVAEMFAIAFVLYGFHTLVDSISEPPTTSSVIIEESAKLLCGAFLVIGAFVGFVGTVWKHTSSMKSETGT